MKNFYWRAATQILAAVLLGNAAQATTFTLVSDGSTLAAATTVSNPQLTTGNTAGLTFGADFLGAAGTFTSPPPGAPAATSVININAAGGGSGFFEITFTLPASFTGISISGAANADDQGYVFLNGTNLTPGGISEYGNVTFSSSTAALFQPGVNTFLVSDINSGGGPSGAAFFANITYSAVVAAPEPATWPIMTSCLALGFVLARLRRAR